MSAVLNFIISGDGVKSDFPGLMDSGQNTCFNHH